MATNNAINETWPIPALAVSAKSIGLLANASIPTIFSGYLIRQNF